MNLQVEIHKKYPGFTLDVNYEVSEKTIGFLGASGSGKSMTMRCIAGLETPDFGRIVLNDKVLFDSEKKINLPSRKRNIGFLFQNYALFPHLSVADNITFGLKNMNKAQKRLKVEEMLSLVKLEGLAKRYPGQLSGGQQQRVALARALAVEPEALFLDEPFSALDNFLKSQMENQLLEILSGYKGVTIFVSHNLEEAYRICNYLYILSEGRIIDSGYKDDIFRQPSNFIAAQLTGCKNISKAKKVDKYKVEALDWGCNLEIKTPVPDNIKYIGIRAHHIKLFQLELLNSGGNENTFSCLVDGYIEGPHRTTVYISLDNFQKEGTDIKLQVEVENEKWKKLKLQPYLYVQFTPEHLIIMK